MTKARIIVDSSVIVSALEPTDASHEVSRAVVEHLINGPYQIRMPMHGLFEIACAFTRLRTVEKTELPPGFSLGWQKIPIEQVPIDGAFIKEYLDQDLPYLKAGDSIFMGLSKKMGLPLITNDQELYTKSQECGVSVFPPQGFLLNAGGA